MLSLNYGPFPPPELPGFVGTTDQSATPFNGPAWPSRVAGWRIHTATAGVSRVTLDSLCMHADAITPVGPPNAVAHLVRWFLPSPKLRRVGPHIRSFEACSAFTHVPACMLTESPMATFCTEGFDGFVTSTAAPIATGWSDQLPGGYVPH